jgi:hypothetical protein
MGLRSLVIAILLCWPASALGQNRTQALLDTIHDDETLVAASRPLFYDLRPLDVPTLQAAVFDNRIPHRKWAAAMTLASSDRLPTSPELVIMVLVEAIHGGGPHTRTLAFQRLESMSRARGYGNVCDRVIDKEVLAGLRDPVYEVRSASLHALSSCDRLPVLIAAKEIAGYRGQDSRVRLLLIGNLSRRGTEARGASDALIASLDDENPDVRRSAAELLRSLAIPPELYVPPIIDDLHTGARATAGAAPIDKLDAVAPAAARWAPDIIELLRSAPDPAFRERLRAALKATGVPEPMEVPEPARVATSHESRRWVASNVGVLAFFAVAAVVTVALVVSGWAGLLGFLFPALPLAAFLLFEGGWWWVTAALMAPVGSVVGAAFGFVSASGESGDKRVACLAAGWVSALSVPVYGFLIVFLYYGLAPLGAG